MDKLVSIMKQSGMDFQEVRNNIKHAGFVADAMNIAMNKIDAGFRELGNAIASAKTPEQVEEEKKHEKKTMVPETVQADKK